MVKYNVVVKSYDDEDYIEVVTKDPVDYQNAVGVDRQVSMEIDEDNFYTEIVKV